MHAAGQYLHEAVFPDESGEELKDLLVSAYKAETVLDFASAKDVLYAEIYDEQDTVRCVYSGWSLYLDPDKDPSVWLYQNGSPNGINAEHTYPRSKGADNGNALSDMYNLYPSRVQVNGDRGNLPFGEIPDNQTDFWYFLSGKTGSVPADHIDMFSEINELWFEPREDHKGNVARSIFYFVTMYWNETQSADPEYFELMRETLCEWHELDPVDSLEWIRNERIASFQSGKRNPFILDCSLPGRLWCDQVGSACLATPVEDIEGIFNGSWAIFPNPSRDGFSIRVPGGMECELELRIYDRNGRCVGTDQHCSMGSASMVQRIEMTSLPPGLYFIRVSAPGRFPGALFQSPLMVE